MGYDIKAEEIIESRDVIDDNDKKDNSILNYSITDETGISTLNPKNKLTENRIIDSNEIMNTRMFSWRKNKCSGFSKVY